MGKKKERGKRKRSSEFINPVNQKGSLCEPKSEPKRFTLRGSMPQLTPSEKEILHLLKEVFLTPQDIAKRRNTSVRAVYKHIANIRKKGFLSKKVYKGFTSSQGGGGGHGSQGGVVPKSEPKKFIRLHGQIFNIEVIKGSKIYIDKYKSNKIIRVDGNTIQISKNTVTIYINHSFIGKNAFEATSKSFEYFNRFLNRLEHDLGCVLWKPKYQNIEMVRSHYAETDNELGREYNKHKKKLQIRAKEDGRVWFLIDNSFNLNEAETIHKKTSMEDNRSVVDFFNDVRDTNFRLEDLYRLQSENEAKFDKVLKNLNELAGLNKNLAQGMNVLLKSQENTTLTLQTLMKTILESKKSLSRDKGGNDYIG